MFWGVQGENFLEEPKGAFQTSFGEFKVFDPLMTCRFAKIRKKLRAGVSCDFKSNELVADF